MISVSSILLLFFHFQTLILPEFLCWLSSFWRFDQSRDTNYALIIKRHYLSPDRWASSSPARTMSRCRRGQNHLRQAKAAENVGLFIILIICLVGDHTGTSSCCLRTCQQVKEPTNCYPSFNHHPSGSKKRFRNIDENEFHCDLGSDFRQITRMYTLWVCVWLKRVHWWGRRWVRRVRRTLWPLMGVTASPCKGSAAGLCLHLLQRASRRKTEAAC